MNVDQHLDVKGLNCPLPMLRAKKALAQLSSGQILEVLATDPGALDDFHAFCRQTGNVLISAESLSEGVLKFLIQRK